MFLIFILQVISEFFPVSSSLLLQTLNMGSESILFHIFSGLLFIIIYFKYLVSLLLRPRDHWKTIVFYIVSALPSAIIGYYTYVQEIFVESKVAIKYSLFFNIIGALLLLWIINNKTKKNQYKKEHNVFSIIDGFYMGIFASLNAFFPGLSRLGMCLTYLLLKNKNIVKAYDIAMISSIPILIGKPLVLLYKSPHQTHILMNFIKSSYLSITISSLLIIYLHRHLKEILSFSFLKTVSIMRIAYYGSYLLYLLYT